jgi:hypothetical protein
LGPPVPAVLRHSPGRARSAQIHGHDERSGFPAANLRHHLAPDAGKTTLTEKLLLFGGAIQLAGAVKARGEARRARIPSFAPELLKKVRAEDPMRSKHLGRALLQLAEEGAAQVFRPTFGNEWIVGVAGALQFDVLADRDSGPWIRIFRNSPPGRTEEATDTHPSQSVGGKLQPSGKEHPLNQRIEAVPGIYIGS